MSMSVTIATSPPAGSDAPTMSPAGAPRGADMPAIHTSGLTKTYGARNAVDGVSIAVPRGVIAGFVGPNGAGKTTTIRMLLGLIRPTAGTAEVLGVATTEPAGYLPHVGALIEGPAFYPGLTARRNLDILATLGRIDRARVDPLLARVGLQGRERDAVKTYSLGMRQRLGIAAALLPDPTMLILDEPTNGLDPAGILEVRQLLRGLRDQGLTVLVSSHLLAEVEQMADWLILLDKGRVVYQGSMEALLSGRTGTLVVGAATAEELGIVAAVARKYQYESAIVDGRLRVQAPAAFARDLNKGAMEACVVLTELRNEQSSLEESFFSLTETEGVAS